MNGEVFHECPVQGQYRRKRDMLLHKFLYDSTKKLKGDIKFRFVSSNKVITCFVMFYYIPLRKLGFVLITC